MTSVLPVDLDYLAARLHGRRSRLAEGERLDALCRLRSIPELIRALAPHSHFTTVNELQRDLISQTVEELTQFMSQLTGAASDLMAWLRVRYQIENLKVLARAFATGKPLNLVRGYLIELPEDLALDNQSLVGANSVEEFANAVPAGLLQDGLTKTAAAYKADPRPIVLEAAFDRVYLQELLKLTDKLPRDARNDALPISRHEVDTFHLMLVARGRFTYRLDAAKLEPLHIAGAAISRNRFEQMLNAPSLRNAACYTVGTVITDLPGNNEEPLDPSVLEVLAWNRYFQLARRTFRRSHMGLGAIVAFTAIRRVEMANLITLSEGIRNSINPEVLRSRMVPVDLEAHRV